MARLDQNFSRVWEPVTFTADGYSPRIELPLINEGNGAIFAAIFAVDVTAFSGFSACQMNLQLYEGETADRYVLYTGAALTGINGVGVWHLTLNPHLNAPVMPAGVAVALPVPPVFRFQMDVTGTGSMTFAVDAVWLER